MPTGSHESYVRAILAPACAPPEEGGLGYRAVVVNYRGCEYIIQLKFTCHCLRAPMCMCPLGVGLSSTVKKTAMHANGSTKCVYEQTKLGKQSFPCLQMICLYCDRRFLACTIDQPRDQHATRIMQMGYLACEPRQSHFRPNVAPRISPFSQRDRLPALAWVPYVALGLTKYSFPQVLACR